MHKQPYDQQRSHGYGQEHRHVFPGDFQPIAFPGVADAADNLRGDHGTGGGEAVEGDSRQDLIASIPQERQTPQQRRRGARASRRQQGNPCGFVGKQHAGEAARQHDALQSVKRSAAAPGNGGRQSAQQQGREKQ